MLKIVEPTMFLREHIELPGDINLVMEAFQEGWNVVQSGNALWLDKQIRPHGWHFAWTPQGLPRSGVGQTREEAFAHAFKLALRRVEERFNAADVRSFEVSEYPGLFVVRMQVFPCEIRPHAVFSPPGKAL
jgi:hypothetical protein